ncbi:hypothetical protein [Acinetobacter sp. P1(2025)]|uniref:hypothetical protein n=1 Tax=Acinetobacter sp. P1(2025) TaxID=3446120 RepID=UPI003F530471
MNTSLTSLLPSQQMLSSDISAITNIRLDSVKRTIERLAERRVITLPPTVEKPTAGRTSTEYVFSGEQGKLDSITVVAQLCPEFTAAMALLHKDLKGKAPLIEPNLRRNLGKWST